MKFPFELRPCTNCNSNGELYCNSALITAAEMFSSSWTKLIEMMGEQGARLGLLEVNFFKAKAERTTQEEEIKIGRDLIKFPFLALFHRLHFIPTFVSISAVSIKDVSRARASKKKLRRFEFAERGGGGSSAK